jgi:DNA-binding response OmpR family regulator
MLAALPDTHLPIILLLEDCAVTGLLVERCVLREIPNVRLLWARSVEEAVARVEDLPVDLFIVDINLPDGSGLDFLWGMAAAHPDAEAIVMTATPLPEHTEHSAALGVLHLLEKPIKIPVLLGHVRDALGAAKSVRASKDFRATLERVTPVDLIQLKCLTRANTVIEFHSEGKTGRIRFEDGEVADASTDARRGVEALFEIIRWRRGQISERTTAGFSERTINVPWHHLLMDAAQQADEQLGAAQASQESPSSDEPPSSSSGRFSATA